jgi:hypothetical protein
MGRALRARYWFLFLFLLGILTVLDSAAQALTPWERCMARNPAGKRLYQQFQDCNDEVDSAPQKAEKRQKPRKTETEKHKLRKVPAKDESREAAKSKPADKQPEKAAQPAETAGREHKPDKTLAGAGKANALVATAREAFAKGRMFEAKAQVEQALAAAPDHIAALTLKAEILAELNQTDDAIAAYSGLIAGKGRAAQPSLLQARGRLYERSGRADLAKADFEAAVKAGGVDPRDKTELAAQEAAFKRLEAQREAESPKAGAAIPRKENRIALVVGNSKYQAVPSLRNPANDARAIAAELRRLGFSEVTELYDAGLSAFSVALRDLGDKALNADWALIYYAGHGIRVDGQNYLIPVDARLLRASHVEDEAISLDRVLTKVGDAKKLRLVILDACRDNPFAARMANEGRMTRQITRGIGRVEPPSGVLVAYSARDGQIAIDGSGKNSPFASALLEHMEDPGIDIRLMFSKVRDSVLSETGNEQEPYTYGSLPGESFVLKAN